MTQQAKQQPPKNNVQLIAYLQGLLARQEYSRAVLAQKLTQRFQLDDAQIESALDYIQQQGWQSDERCAQRLVSVELSKYRGPKRIYQKAFQKGLDVSLIDQVFQQQPLDWFEIACKSLQRRFNTLDWHDQKQYQRAVRYLMGQGFDSSLIYQVTEQAAKTGESFFNKVE